MSAQQAHTHVHFLGIGGVGVSGLARIMLARGATVSGTDAKDLPILEELSDLGAHTFVGYSADNISAAQQISPITMVVASSVAGPDNPEYQAAVAAGIPVLHRSEGLVAAMEGKKVLTVAGTHGKTTTSSMAAMMLHHAGYQPAFAVGAAVAGLNVNAAYGAGEWFVAEADESDGTLVNYHPDIAIVTNIEADHLDHYGTEEAVHQVFADHAGNINPGGVLIVCADDPGAAALGNRVEQTVPSSKVRVLRYGSTPSCDLYIADVQPATAGTGQRVSLRTQQQEAISLELHQPGMHNARNAAAVFLAGKSVGLENQEITAGLAAFRGSARRFEYHGEYNSIRVFDDYAHHPTEVEAAITAARSMAAGSKVHVIFQPHLFSRTRDFATEFAQALSLADTVRVLDIYPAREEPLPGVTSVLITSKLAPELTKLYPQARQPASTEEAVTSVVARSAPGDLILTLGAGDVTALAPQIVAQLKERYQG